MADADQFTSANVVSYLREQEGLHPDSQISVSQVGMSEGLSVWHVLTDQDQLFEVECDGDTPLSHTEVKE